MDLAVSSQCRAQIVLVDPNGGIVTLVNSTSDIGCLNTDLKVISVKEDKQKKASF